MAGAARRCITTSPFRRAISARGSTPRGLDDKAKPAKGTLLRRTLLNRRDFVRLSRTAGRQPSPGCSTCGCSSSSFNSEPSSILTFSTSITRPASSPATTCARDLQSESAWPLMVTRPGHKLRIRVNSQLPPNHSRHATRGNRSDEQSSRIQHHQPPRSRPSGGAAHFEPIGTTLPLKTPYPAIVQDNALRLASLRGRGVNADQRCRLVIDQTGSGAPCSICSSKRDYSPESRLQAAIHFQSLT